MGFRFFITIFISFLFSVRVFAANDYLKPDVFENEKASLKMLVFLSEKCPCSKSHIAHVQELMDHYKELKVYGVISEPARNQKEEKIKNSYFQNEKFGFPIINDQEQFLVKKYQALKTPHVVLLEKTKHEDYKVVYEGGLTDSKHYNPTSKKYVEDALKQISKNEKVRIKNGFCLGCHIRRF